ncbi:MAG: response regulator [Deltaproteobacteria bacterium]|nr:response regulator [Deltaproteobacteria bacterium]
MNSITKSVTILLVEDDPGHARLVEKNLRRANIHNPIVKFEDGGRAMDYLFGEGAYSGNPTPENLLVLLDLNLPVMDGYQILRRMKEDESTRRIPVIILTTTDDPREIVRCYDLGCNVYITKPVDYEEFSEAIRKLGLFLSVVVIPQEGPYSHE